MSVDNNIKVTDSISTVCGLDALYYQLKIEFQSYIYFYMDCTKNKLAIFGNFRIISENWQKQYTFFELKDSSNDKIIARIGFKNLNTKDNLEYVKVQLDSYYMNIYGERFACDRVHEELSSLGLEILTSKIQRVDLNTYVYGYDFTYISYYSFSTLVRSNSKVYSAKIDKLATFYLGSRSNPSAPLLRIYDKWLELNQSDKQEEKEKKDQKKQMICLKFKEQHNINLDDRIPLWNVEFELKRDLLKIYNINTLEQLFSSVNMLHSDIMKRQRLLIRKRRLKENHTDRIPTAPIWNRIERNYNFMDSNLPVDRIIPIRHSKHLEWLKNRLREYKAVQSDNLTDTQILLELSNELKQIALEKHLIKQENQTYE